MALTWKGVTAFSQVSPPQWNFGDFFGMDSLSVFYRGAVTYLNAFLAGKSKGTPSEIDGNMYLTGISVDDHKQYPTVVLSYTGVKGGGLPPSKSFLGKSVQQARFNAFDGNLWVEITYIAPSSSKRIWARSPIDLASVGAVVAANCEVIWFTASGVLIPVTNQQAALYFRQREVILGESEEIVPGRYYAGTQTRQNLLFSSQG